MGDPRILEGNNPEVKKFFCFEKEIQTLISLVHNVNFAVFYSFVFHEQFLCYA